MFISEKVHIVGKKKFSLLIDCDLKTSCQSCVNSDNCGTKLFTRNTQSISIHIPCTYTAKYHIGDSIQIGLQKTHFFYALLICYGCPLLSMLIGGFLAYSYKPTDVLFLFGAIVGIYLGYYASKQLLKNFSPQLFIMEHNQP